VTDGIAEVRSTCSTPTIRPSLYDQAGNTFVKSLEGGANSEAAATSASNSKR
jgi:hypothetical protein